MLLLSVVFLLHVFICFGVDAERGRGDERWVGEILGCLWSRLYSFLSTWYGTEVNEI